MQVETIQALQVERRMPVEHVVHRDRYRRLSRDAMATSATWPTNGGCAHLHGNASGTRNLGGIRRSLPGVVMRMSYTRRAIVALSAVVLVAMTAPAAFALTAGSAGPPPGPAARIGALLHRLAMGSRGAQCGWFVDVSAQTLNVAAPDTHSNYWIQPYLSGTGSAAGHPRHLSCFPVLLIYRIRGQWPGDQRHRPARHPDCPGHWQRQSVHDAKSADRSRRTSILCPGCVVAATVHHR